MHILDNIRLYGENMPRRKKERYIDRWRREHKEVKFYFKREEYKVLEELASKHNMTVKEFILKFINDVRAAAKGEYNRGYSAAINDLIKDPYTIHTIVREILKYKGDIALFEVPCKYCGEPVVLTHKSKYWESHIKPELLRVFKDWYHSGCGK